jgi:hypothetical protein
VNPKKKTWALQLGLEDATWWLSSVAHSRKGRLAMQNCAAAGLLMQQKFMKNWQRGVPNTPVRPITIQTKENANPVDTISVSDNTSVSDLGTSHEDNNGANSEALIGLEIDLSDDEPSKAGYRCESDNLDEWEQPMNTLTVPDCISVFSSESTNDSTAFDDMSFSSSPDETFGDDSTWKPE